MRAPCQAHASSCSPTPAAAVSNLFEARQLHPRLSILEEPFNEGFSRWYPDERRYRDLVTDEASLDEQLAHMFEHYDGIKLLDYQLPGELTARMLGRADVKVVFLRRRNLLRSVVSVLIAEHSGLWKKWEQERPIEQLYADLPPLDVGEFGERIRAMAARLDDYVRHRRPTDTVRKLVYEDLYFAPAAVRRTEFDALVSFLGAEPFDDPHKSCASTDIVGHFCPRTSLTISGRPSLTLFRPAPARRGRGTALGVRRPGAAGGKREPAEAYAGPRY